MAKISKTDAAKLIGVARQTIYDYIKQGRISADSDGQIDTSELIRAGFTLRLPDSPPNVGSGHDPTDEATESDSRPAHLDVISLAKVMDLYEQRIALLERELADSKRREEETLRREERVLAMLEQEQKQRQLYLPAPSAEGSGGILSRIFSRKRTRPT
jgi:hypothetical protein